MNNTPISPKEAQLITQQYAQAYALPLVLRMQAMGTDWTLENDGEQGVLCVPRELLRQMPSWAGYYSLYKQLCLAHQALRPTDFDADVQRSRLYRIGQDGLCARLVQEQWLAVRCTHLSPLQWQAAATNAPHEAYARQFAVEQAYDCLTNDCDRDSLHGLAYWDGGKGSFGRAEYRDLWDYIDRALGVSHE